MDIDGVWENQNGSRLLVAESDRHTFSGEFFSEKGRAERGKGYPVKGVHNGELMSFLVDFRDEHANLAAVTSFSGRLATTPEGRRVLHTMWTLARQYEDSERSRPTQPWNSFLINSDVFTKLD